MKNPITGYVLAFCSVACLGAAGCGESPSEPANMVDDGSWYVTGFRWPHDGRPYESENLVVYSDGASDHARQYLAQLGEELLAELTQQFGVVSEDMFCFPAGQDKIHVFAYKNHFPRDWGGLGLLRRVADILLGSQRAWGDRSHRTRSVCPCCEARAHACGGVTDKSERQSRFGGRVVD